MCICDSYVYQKGVICFSSPYYHYYYLYLVKYE